MSHVHVQQPWMREWNTGICGCLEDRQSCCFAFWCCPCFARTVIKGLGESTCLPLVDICGPGIFACFGIPLCVPPVSLGVRVALRHKYHIKGSICKDILVSCFCVWCSWCQMNREILVHLLTPVGRPMSQAMPMSTTTQVITTQVVQM